MCIFDASLLLQIIDDTQTILRYDDTHDGFNGADNICLQTLPFAYATIQPQYLVVSFSLKPLKDAP